MNRFLGREGFGPAAAAADRPTLEAAWRDGGTAHDRVGAAIGLAKLGDFSTRDGLLDMLLAGVDDEGLAIDLQHLVVSIASEETVLDPRFVRLASREVDTLLYLLAGSGASLLARAAVPIYLGLAQFLEGGPQEFLDAATDSGWALTGVYFDDLDDDGEVTIQTWGTQAMAAVSSVDARYVAGGAPFHPASTAKDLTAFAMRSEKQGKPFVGRAVGERLATWSGIPCPVTESRVLTGDDVRRLVEYALTLSRLPWRPGVKDFYGHDVDGGLALHATA